MNRRHDLKEYFRGCLIGGAIGDALGYPVEFLTIEEIRAKYGRWGIDNFELAPNGKALISDDTQMTLFTANGILVGSTQFAYRKQINPLVNYLFYAYQDWLKSQGIEKNITNPERQDSWLMEVPELQNRRSPGKTNIAALSLRGLDRQITLNKPVNDSKGCGAVMRIAPLGLIAHQYGDPFFESARIGAITHGHPLSILSCQLMTSIIDNIIKDDDKTLWTIIKDSIKNLKEAYDKEFASHLKETQGRVKAFLPEFIELMKSALIKVKYMAIMEKKNKNVNDVDTISSIGQGWVAEEALAIALYCSVRYSLDPMAGIRAAANHSGDSDSTASLTGQILGAYHGLKAFPDEYIRDLEISDVIMEIADDLATGCTFNDESPASIEKEKWETKYLYHHRYKK